MKVKFFSFVGLLVSFVALFAILPLAANYDFVHIFLQVSFTAIVFFSVYAVAENRTYFIVAIVLAVPGVLINWIETLDTSLTAQIINNFFSIALYSYVSYVVLLYIFHRKVVSVNVIYGAVSVYMLLGLIWASAFTLLELVIPGSFNGLPYAGSLMSSAELVNFHLQSLFYYSYITITTLGNGNISPATVAASALSSSEAVIGQLYITVLIARFVGLHIAQQRNAD